MISTAAVLWAASRRRAENRATTAAFSTVYTVLCRRGARQPTQITYSQLDKVRAYNRPTIWHVSDGCVWVCVRNWNNTLVNGCLCFFVFLLDGLPFRIDERRCLRGVVELARHSIYMILVGMRVACSWLRWTHSSIYCMCVCVWVFLDDTEIYRRIWSSHWYWDVSSITYLNSEYTRGYVLPFNIMLFHVILKILYCCSPIIEHVLTAITPILTDLRSLTFSLCLL